MSLREKLNVIHGLVVCITEANKELQGYGERLEKLAREVIYEDLRITAKSVGKRPGETKRRVPPNKRSP